MTAVPFLPALRDDIRAHLPGAASVGLRRSFDTLRVAAFSSGFHLTASYRASHAIRCRWGWPGRPIAAALYWLNRHFYGCSIAPTARIAGGLILPHPQGIVIGPGATVGPRAWIFQNVTIGGLPDRKGLPRIGADARIYAGAVVAGPIALGDGVVVGANAVVHRDIPSGHIAARPIRGFGASVATARIRPRERVAPMNDRRNDRIGLATACLVYIVLFARYYPPISGIEDEVGFVNQALVWSRGAFSSEAAGFAEVHDFGMPGVRPHLIDFVRVGNRHVSGRHPGRSLVYLPFYLLGGVAGGFASGALIHLSTTLVAARLLERIGRSPLWAVGVLCHPTLALYSRTIMGDEAAGAGLLIAALCTVGGGVRGAVGAGLAVALAATMRYHAGLALPIIAGAIMLDRTRCRRLRDGIACLAAGGVGGMALVAYNMALYGAPLDSVGSSRGQFGFHFLSDNAPFYALALSTFWPAMLFAPALDRSPHGRLARPLAVVYFGFFSLYYFHDRAGGRLETLAVGLRLLQVVLPVWIVSYASALSPIAAVVGRRTRTVAAVATVAGLLAGTGVAFARHQGHLVALVEARDALASEVPDGSVVVEHGAVHKLLAIPGARPSYRWRLLDFQGATNDHDAELRGLRGDWFLAILTRDGILPDAAASLIRRHGMNQIRPDVAGLLLYRASPAPGPTP